MWEIILLISLCSCSACLGTYCGNLLYTKFYSKSERLENMPKDSPKGNQGKAPNTGSNTKQQRDNKATATGKPVDPNRPHMDR